MPDPKFSRQARSLAAPFKAPEKPQEQPPTAPALLTEVPLDRRRNVPISGMDTEQLTRALEQAKRRLNRTRPSADQDRFAAQLHSIHTEAQRRLAEHSTDQQEPGPDPPEQQPDSPPPGTGPGGPDPSAVGVNFSAHPADTYK